VHRDRHTLLRLMAAVLCVAFIVIVLLKGVWILAIFGAAMLALQIINLVLGPRRRRRPPAPRAPVAEPTPRRTTPRSSEAARQRARRGRGR
jgi:hypothetical protein